MVCHDYRLPSRPPPLLQHPSWSPCPPCLDTCFSTVPIFTPADSHGCWAQCQLHSAGYSTVGTSILPARVREACLGHGLVRNKLHPASYLSLIRVSHEINGELSVDLTWLGPLLTLLTPRKLPPPRAAALPVSTGPHAAILGMPQNTITSPLPRSHLESMDSRLSSPCHSEVCVGVLVSFLELSLLWVLSIPWRLRLHPRRCPPPSPFPALSQGD